MNEFVLAPDRHGPFPGQLAPDTIAAYAAATVITPRRCWTGTLYLRCFR